MPRIGNQTLLPNEGRLVKFIKLNEPSSVYFGARGGSTFGNERVGVPPFALGGANAFAAIAKTNCSPTSTTSSRRDIFAR